MNTVDNNSELLSRIKELILNKFEKCEFLLNSEIYEEFTHSRTIIKFMKAYYVIRKDLLSTDKVFINCNFCKNEIILKHEDVDLTSKNFISIILFSLQVIMNNEYNNSIKNVVEIISTFLENSMNELYELKLNTEKQKTIEIIRENLLYRKYNLGSLKDSPESNYFKDFIILIELYTIFYNVFNKNTLRCCNKCNEDNDSLAIINDLVYNYCFEVIDITLKEIFKNYENRSLIEKLLKETYLTSKD